jgi:hypothetical protein
VAIAATALAALALPGQAGAGRSCVRWASSAGNDGNAGTRQAPFRSAGRLLAALGPGQTGCLAGGSQFAEHLVVGRAGRRGAPVRIRTWGKPRAVLSGTVRVERGGHDFILAAVVVQGDGSPGKAIVGVRGSRVTLVRVAVSGPGYMNRRLACIAVSGQAWHVVLDHVEVHDCTRVTRHRAFGPGIAVAHAHATRIRDSFVYHVSGAGIALGPDSQGTRVTRTILDGNRSGVFIGGGKRRASSGNVVTQSILSFSGRWNVHSSWAGRVGGGNVVTGNCIWRGFRRNLSGTGYAAYGNLFAAPRYVNRPASLSIRPGPCYGKRPRPAALSPTDLGLPWPKLGRFTIHYTLRALRARVQVVSLRMTGLHPGAPVELRCRSGCSLTERLRAGGGGAAASALLPGLWLLRGAVLEVRERRAGWVGAFARVRVTGLPRGVAIEHSCLSPLEMESPVRCEVFA